MRRRSFLRTVVCAALVGFVDLERLAPSMEGVTYTATVPVSASTLAAIQSNRGAFEALTQRIFDEMWSGYVREEARWYG